ncbi:MAG: hypothetical protein AABW53_01630 [Nanoarchaeota archaeon]
MVLENLAQQILSLVNWGITIIVLMIVWEIIQLAQKSNVISNFAGGSFNAAVWMKNLPRRFARRTHKAELNEYIDEEKEEKNLDTLKHGALDVLAELETYGNRRYFVVSEHTKLVRTILGFGENLRAVKRTFTDLSKTTNRADRKLDKMFDYFKKKKIKVPDEVKALENNILLLHQQTARDIAGVEDVYRGILTSDDMKALESLKPEMFEGGPYRILTDSVPFNLKQLYKLIEGFRKEEFLLEDAYKRQGEAKKEMTGIIQETRSLYE